MDSHSFTELIMRHLYGFSNLKTQKDKSQNDFNNFMNMILMYNRTEFMVMQVHYLDAYVILIASTALIILALNICITWWYLKINSLG